MELDFQNIMMHFVWSFNENNHGLWTEVVYNYYCFESLTLTCYKYLMVNYYTINNFIYICDEIFKNYNIHYLDLLCTCDAQLNINNIFKDLSLYTACIFL